VAQAGDDRYSLERRAERVGADANPLVAEAGPVIFGDPDARFAGLLTILVDAVGRLRTVILRTNVLVHAFRPTPTHAIWRTGSWRTPGVPGSGRHSGTRTTPGSISSRPSKSSLIWAIVRN
jgi:hypothetical protein